jgi:acyl carrier protein
LGFVDDLVGSSLDDAELIMALEAAFGIDGIPLEDAGKIRKLRTLEQVRDYIRKLKKGGD